MEKDRKKDGFAAIEKTALMEGDFDNAEEKAKAFIQSEGKSWGKRLETVVSLSALCG